MTQGRMMPIVGMVVLLAVSVGLLIAPAYRRSSYLSSEIDRLEHELAKPNSGPEVIGRLTGELESLRALTDWRMTPIPEESDVAGLIRDLSSMLDTLGLGRREITTGESRALEEASSMPMTVTLEGPFPSVAEAVRRIESLPRLVRVQRLRVAAGRSHRNEGVKSDVNRTGEVRADLLLEVFFAPRDVLTASAEGGRDGR